MPDPDNLGKTEEVRLPDGYPDIVPIDYALFNTLRYVARARSTIHPSEVAAITGMNSYRGTGLRRSMARLRARCEQMEWPDITCLLVAKGDGRTNTTRTTVAGAEWRAKATVHDYDWWSIEETEPSRVADDVWHTIREGEAVLKQQGRRTRFSGARHLVTTHGERAAVATTLRSSPGFGVMDEAHSLHLTFEAVVRVNPGGFPLEDAFLAQRRLEAAGSDLAVIAVYWERIHRGRR